MKPTRSSRTKASSTSPTTGWITTGARSSSGPRLDNKDHLLNPGLFVRVRLPIGDAHEAVMIRERALAVNHKDVDGKQVREKGIYVLADADEIGKPIAKRHGRQRKRGPGSSTRLEEYWQPRRRARRIRGNRKGRARG